MSRFEEVARIYKEVEDANEEIIRNNPNSMEIMRTTIILDISQSLKNIDITLAKLYDREVGETD